MMIIANRNSIDAVVINLCQCSNSGMHRSQKGRNSKVLSGWCYYDIDYCGKGSML